MKKLTLLVTLITFLSLSCSTTPKEVIDDGHKVNTVDESPRVTKTDDQPKASIIDNSLKMAIIDDSPRVIDENGKSILKIPESLSNEMLKVFSNYRLPNETEYIKGSDWDLNKNGSLPYALNEDLNNDEKKDLALILVNKKNIFDFILVGFMSSKKGYKLVDISKRRLISADVPIHNYYLFFYNKCIGFFKYESEGIYFCHTKDDIFETRSDDYD
jgi:hypothetical protein